MSAEETQVITPAPDATAKADANANPDSSAGANDSGDKSEGKDAIQKRIDKLTGKLRQAERERDYERELRLATAQRNVEPPAKSPEPARTAPKKLADFEYDEEKYAEYLVDYAADQAATRLEERSKQKRTEDSRKEKFSQFKEYESKFKTSIEDYDDVAHYARINDNVADLVMDLGESAPAMAYHLGKNPDLAARLNKMSDSAVAVELGRIDAKLAIEREQAKAKTVSKAPPPPPKIDATDPVVEKDPTQMSDAEFAKWRKKQIAARRR